ncbi:MAG TPA: hypothetical protein VFW47_12065 [Phenylobacterium sp.]|nr:hypothetical protein [Phenylobacterium sp.]
MKPIALAAALALCASAALAEPTHVMVRAQSLDAKFIGSQMGGVQVTLRDARTGKVLAKGLTRGGTGDTARIMRMPRERGAVIAGGDTAGFDAVLDLKQPTLVKAEAFGPAGSPASAVQVSSSLWVIPGRDVAGDGWILTFPGLAIEPRATPGADGSLRVEAKVTLMCGCPIEPGGLWDAAQYGVTAALLRGGRQVAQIPLAYAGRPSQFAADLPKVRPGRYVLRIVATDTRTPNAGVVEIPVRISAR